MGLNLAYGMVLGVWEWYIAGGRNNQRMEVVFGIKGEYSGYGDGIERTGGW